jgi:hypothetical protein
MIVFFSGDTDACNYPEVVLKPEKCLGSMLTYYDIHTKKGVSKRFKSLVDMNEVAGKQKRGVDNATV